MDYITIAIVIYRWKLQGFWKKLHRLFRTNMVWSYLERNTDGDLVLHCVWFAAIEFHISVGVSSLRSNFILCCALSKSSTRENYPFLWIQGFFELVSYVLRSMLKERSKRRQMKRFVLLSRSSPISLHVSDVMFIP